MTNEQRQNWGASQSNQWNQVCKGSEGVLWYSKWVKGRGGSTNLSQGACILNAIINFPLTNQHCFLVGFLKEVLKQNPSYQISKHHPNLCPQGFPSYFPRQIEITKVRDYVIQHSTPEML